MIIITTKKGIYIVRDCDIQILLGVLRNRSCITALKFVGNGRRSMEWWKTILVALEKNTSVQTLDLSGNLLSDEFCTLLVNTLCVNKTIRAINLAHNMLSGEGIKTLAWAFETNLIASITSLNLVNNAFDLEDATYILEAMSGNKTVRRLCLFDKCPENFSEYELAIVNCLRTNRVLLEVQIGKVAEFGRLKEILDRNRAIIAPVLLFGMRHIPGCIWRQVPRDIVNIVARQIWAVGQTTIWLKFDESDTDSEDWDGDDGSDGVELY